MLVLIFLLIFGSAIAYFAIQNSTYVTITVAQYTFSQVPLFYVIVSSMLAGLLAAYVIYLISTISSSITIHGKDKKIEETEKELTELTKQVHQLELENTKLKAESGKETIDDKSL